MIYIGHRISLSQVLSQIKFFLLNRFEFDITQKRLNHN